MAMSASTEVRQLPLAGGQGDEPARDGMLLGAAARTLTETRLQREIRKGDENAG
jgi:hypothetical protein